MIAIGRMGTVSEARSRQLVEAAGIPVSPWASAGDPNSAVEAAKGLGFPVAVKLNGDTVIHKTEEGLVRLGLASPDQVAEAAAELLAGAGEGADLLVTQMVAGHRELIAGLVHDERFGPCVMLGLGGVLAEAMADVAFRLAPLGVVDALDLIDDLGAQALLGPLRGEPALDREATADLLVAIGTMADDPAVVAVDLNPLVVADGRPVAVDALVELSDGAQ